MSAAVDQSAWTEHDMLTTTPIRAKLRRVLVIVALADVLAMTTAVILAWNLRLMIDFGELAEVSTSDSLAVAAGPWIIGVWILILAAQGAYSTRIFGSGAEEFRLVILASVITAGTSGMYCYLVQLQLSRGFLLLTFLIGVPLLVLERYVARKTLHVLRMQGRLQHRVLAVGGPSGIAELVDVLGREKYAGYEVVGACVPVGITALPGDLSVPVLGSVSDTRRVCDEIAADAVLVARGGYSTATDLRRIAWDLEGSDIELVVVPSLTDIAGPRIHMRPVAGLPLLHVEGPQVDEAGGLSKRSFDIMSAALVLFLLAPLMLVMALLIRLHDGGPVFFIQERVGRGGRTFGMVKFRSMVQDAEHRLEAIQHLNESDGVTFKIADDPRVTPIGRFIRKHSIDEVPQLINVVRGEMSMVGPRPPLPSEVENYAQDVHRRLLVRPGLTGLWQVSGRSELSWNESVRLDLYYVDNWSMTGDLVILVKTIRAVFGSHGAY